MSIEINPKVSLFQLKSYFNEQSAIRKSTDDIVLASVNACPKCTGTILTIPEFGSKEVKLNRAEKFLQRAKKTLEEIGVG